MSEEGILYDMYGNSEAILADNGYFEITAGESPCYLEVSSFKVKSAGFEKTNSGIRFCVNLINNSSQEKDLTVFIASYKNDGRLLDIKMNKIKAEAGFDDFVKTAEIIKDADTASVKGFLWNKAGTPLISEIFMDF